MANEISLDLSNPDLAPLKGKQPGDTCDLKSVTVKVTGNDGKTLTGDIVEVELGDDYQSGDDDSGGESNEPASDGDEQPADKKPIAVIAIGMSKKKPM